MQNLLEMLSEMTRDQDAESEKKRLVEKLKTIDLLIIDEAFSKDKVTLYKSGFQLPFLDRFLRERFEMYRKGIVFISNNPPEAITQQGFSKSIEDLVTRKTRPNGSALEFLDNYVKSASNFNVRGIFD
jgi:DNA replication protein DnaC